MERYDLYRDVHKGIRSALFGAALTVARTDFGRDEELSAALDVVRGVLAFLDEHAEHEDAVILPELARHAPELHAALRAEHARVEGLGHELERLVERLESATGAARLALGERLHHRIGALVAAHLEHMEREESEANRVLWAHLGDGELQALEQRIVASIEPARMGEWLALMLPAMNAPARAALLSAMRGALAPEAFGELTAPARGALGRDEWARATAHA